MNSHAWNLWLSTLPPGRRREYECLLDRITTLLAHDRIVILDELTRVEQGIEELRDVRAVGEAARPVAGAI